MGLSAFNRARERQARERADVEQVEGEQMENVTPPVEPNTEKHEVTAEEKPTKKRRGV